jgi:hypothetical protein
MPELRGGVWRARLRSKKVYDVQDADPAASPVSPAPRGRTGRRGGAAAGRGNKTVAEGGGRKALKPRGKGCRAVDLCEDQPCKDLPEGIARKAVTGKAQEDLGLNKVADRAANLMMDGESGDKFAAAEDESTTTPVPERVWNTFFPLHFCRCTIICTDKVIFFKFFNMGCFIIFVYFVW